MVLTTLDIFIILGFMALTLVVGLVVSLRQTRLARAALATAERESENYRFIDELLLETIGSPHPLASGPHARVADLLDGALDTVRERAADRPDTLALLEAAIGNYGEAGFYFLLLSANALLLLWIASAVAERFFYPGWSELFGGDSKASRPLRSPLRHLDRWTRTSGCAATSPSPATRSAGSRTSC